MDGAYGKEGRAGGGGGVAQSNPFMGSSKVRLRPGGWGTKPACFGEGRNGVVKSLLGIGFPCTSSPVFVLCSSLECKFAFLILLYENDVTCLLGVNLKCAYLVSCI